MRAQAQEDILIQISLATYWKQVSVEANKAVYEPTTASSEAKQALREFTTISSEANLALHEPIN